jgi:dsDNA-specific endonuclease/ATPase MutS2
MEKTATRETGIKAQARTTVEEIYKDLQSLSEKADKSRERSKEELERIMSDLKEQEEALKQKYQKLHEATDEGLDNAKSAFSKSAAALRSSIEATIEKLN